MKIYLAWLCACMLSRVWLFVTLWTVVLQALLSMEYWQEFMSRQEYWSELPFPPPGDLSDPGIELCILRLLCWWANSLPWATWEANLTTHTLNKAARHLKYKAESWDWWCSGSVSCQGLAGVEGVWQGLLKEEERYYWWTGIVLRDRVIQIEGWGKCDALQLTGQTYFFSAQGLECALACPHVHLPPFIVLPVCPRDFWPSLVCLWVVNAYDFPGGSEVKRLPTTWETRVQSLGSEDPLEKAMAPVFLSGKSHCQRSLGGYSPPGHKELDTTERLHFSAWAVLEPLQNPC